MTGPAVKRQPKDAAKYLLPGEELVVATRRHPAVLALPALKALPGVVAGLWLVSVSGDSRLGGVLGLVALVGAVGYLAVHVGEWWIRHFLISKRRVMLISGVVVRTVAVMPLRRITDMTWQETPVGQLLGYGTFRFESAGQDQALSTVTYLPHAGELYLAVSELLFGRDWSSSGGAEDEGEEQRSAQRPPSPRPPVPPAPSDRQDTQPIPRVPPSRW